MTTAHLQQVEINTTGVVPPPRVISEMSAKINELMERNAESKKYFCVPCQHDCKLFSRYKKHIKSDKHYKAIGEGWRVDAKRLARREEKKAAGAPKPGPKRSYE